MEVGGRFGEVGRGCREVGGGLSGGESLQTGLCLWCCFQLSNPESCTMSRGGTEEGKGEVTRVERGREEKRREGKGRVEKSRVERRRVG